MEKTLIDWNSSEPVVMGEFTGALPEEVENCVLFRTSGSSGSPKMVALTRESLAWSAQNVNAHFQLHSADVFGLALPTIHVGGFGVVARSHFAGADLRTYPGKWEARRFVDWLAGVTVTSLVPTQVTDLVEARLTGPSSLRLVIVGGGVLSDSLREQARLLGWPVMPSYGMTETASQIATGDGLPLLPGWQAEVRDGRIAAHGPGLLHGYVIEGRFVDPKEDGWFLTQDRGDVHEGKLTIFGRADRQVKILGELVDLESLENEWAQTLGAEVALIAQPDQRRGHTLLLVTTGDLQSIAILNASWPGPERLNQWIHVPNLPRTALGKLDRQALKELLKK